MAKSPCKCKPTECEECPEWIFTFADLVMLMMGFFVILWVLKPSPNPKGGASDDDYQVKVYAAIRDAFGYVPNPNSKDPVDMKMMMEKFESLKIPSGSEDGRGELTAAGGDGDDFPVYNVNYPEAEAFCRKLTELSRESGDLPKDWEFRLPSSPQEE